MQQNNQYSNPPVPFYSLDATLNTGERLEFSSLRGKKVLIVNTASDCGYTPQYAALQELHEKSGDKLVIIGFPSNDFGEQEKGDDATIAEFCKLNYGVSFPLATKSVVKGVNRHRVFQWLSDKDQNGWNEQQPTWNFSKYLVDENGVLLQFLEPGIEPTDPRVLELINRGK